MITKTLLAATALASVLCLSACGTHAVRCDGKLSPINLPASVSEHESQPEAEVRP
jgi:hypothetical protein